MPVTGIESWTVLGDDGAVVAPAERYLAYLSSLERSPNTVRAYAMSLLACGVAADGDDCRLVEDLLEGGALQVADLPVCRRTGARPTVAASWSPAAKRLLPPVTAGSSAVRGGVRVALEHCLDALVS